MLIKQFEDKNLAHYSYALISNGQMALIDPARNPQPYYDLAREHDVKISAVIETHPHADFVSSHAEIHRSTDATIYISRLAGAEYEHRGFDEGDELKIGKLLLKPLNTPGHSPDSISIVVYDEDGNEKAVFTGDTLFIGDCGRPDLRESVGAITATRTDLARQMYHSLRNKLMMLQKDVLVFPAHGAGSLCGKALSASNVSTIGTEMLTNWSLARMPEEEFINRLLEEQPFIPKYFPFNVGLNKKGAPDHASSVAKVIRREPVSCAGCAASLNPKILIIDTRKESEFKKGHLKRAINLMDDMKFETWLGSIIAPDEKFYLVAESDDALTVLIERAAKIGYEAQIEMAFVASFDEEKAPVFNESNISSVNDKYTIVDVRNDSEVSTKRIFSNAIHIPLNELRERASEIPKGKPILVHCAGGYRSAAASSIIKSQLNGDSQVFDFGKAIKELTT